MKWVVCAALAIFSGLCFFRACEFLYPEWRVPTERTICLPSGTAIPGTQLILKF